jgi:DNA-binding HxlR family transcriptional regulator
VKKRRRSYHQYCAGARALDVVGERWTLLIARDLLLGPRRYTDLLEGLPGITTNLLAKRLAEMTEAGIIRREKQQRAEVYSLTQRGLALEPVLLELARWGGALMGMPQPGDARNPGWALLSLKNFYRGGLTLELELRIDGVPFELVFLPKKLRIQQRSATCPAAVVTTTHLVLARLLFAREPLHGLTEVGLVAIAGDARAFSAVLEATVP